MDLVVRAVSCRDGQYTVFLGVTPADVRIMRSGHPIVVKADEIGVDLDVVLMLGDSEPAIEDELRASGIEVPAVNAH